MHRLLAIVALCLAAAILAPFAQAEDRTHADPPAQAHEASQTPPSEPSAELPSAAEAARELRGEVQAALAESAFVRKPNSRETRLRSQAELESLAHRLLDLHARLEQPSALAPSQRARLKTQVRSRLLGLADILAQRANDEPSVPSVPSARDDKNDDGEVPSPGAPGGGVQSGDLGLELVELIQSTVAPETWDVNGGQGTIRYWAPMRVLVVRQTGEVHGQVGGVVRGLRRR